MPPIPMVALPSRLGAEGHGLIGVGAGLSGAGSRAGLVSSYPFPITGAKIHPPLLRSDTLSRPRLNSWLDRAAAGRVALIVAEAGFGKTTLLADWASQSPRRTAWYRLEPDDADWLVFLRHLVAAGRELDPDFGTDALELILSLGAGGPTQDDIIAALVREYGDFAAALPDGLTLIIDDHHAIEGSEETAAILRALVERTGEDFSIIISSRTAPTLPLGRLRARGALNRLDGTDLCFDVPETERLFREAYRHPLEPDVIAELIKRTDGWAALLTLVRTGLEDKAPTEARALVGQLSATRGDLYDFLAEEVLASLSPRLQRFLTRVAVLVSVDVEMGVLVDDLPATEVAPLITEAEALGLLSRPDRESPHRFHALVRDFLLARLTDEIGLDAVRELHRRVAVALEGRDWFGAAWHYRAAGMIESSVRVIAVALPTILASGSSELASQLIEAVSAAEYGTAGFVILSRVELERGNYQRALDLAKTAVDADAGAMASIALLNLAFLKSMLGYGEEFVGLASQAIHADLPPDQADLARVAIAVAGSQVEGNLEEVADQLGALAAIQAARQHRHYAGISRLNRSWVLLWLARTEEAVATSAEAEIDLGRSSDSVYRVGAMMARAHGLARLGRMDEARALIRAAQASPSPLARDEASIEGGALLVDFSSEEEAEAALAARGTAMTTPQYRLIQTLHWATLAFRRGAIDEASHLAQALEDEAYPDVAGRLRVRILQSRIAVARADTTALTFIDDVERLGSVQRSPIGVHAAELLRAVHLRTGLDHAVEAAATRNLYVLSMLAEEVIAGLPLLGSVSRQRVEVEATQHPERWASALRRVLAGGPSDAFDSAARLLASIGTGEDAAYLRQLAKAYPRLKVPALQATRRLAEAVLVDDLGSVKIYKGDLKIGGLRRRVAGLLCFLSSRPGMSATRDEVIEALWPELGSETAGNSLHQTIYFLRRVFEPDYREGLSAGYLAFDGDVVALHGDLVDTTSRRCWRVLTERRVPTPATADALLDLYTARYALDFAYEEWAVPYGETLHAAVLAHTEAGLEAAARSGDWEGAMSLARRLLAVDPTADAIELELLRAYKRGGRRAAAAEQYAHYATMLRDELGLEPPAFEDL